MIRPRYWEVKSYDEIIDPKIVRELWESGKTMKFICEQLGAKFHQIQWIKRKYDIQRKFEPFTFNSYAEFLRQQETREFEKRAKISLEPFVQELKTHWRIIGRRNNSLRNKRVKQGSIGLTEAEKKEIQEFYINCPEGYEVDHIYPLSKGGKHHMSNLQYLPISENRRKGSKILCS